MPSVQHLSSDNLVSKTPLLLIATPPLMLLAPSFSRGVITVRLEPSFSFTYSPLPLPFLLYYGHPPFAPCNSLELDLLSDTKARTRCLADYAPSPLSITCLTLTLTVLPTCASVPADVHPLCTLGAPFVPVPPHRCLMYHCTFCARFLTP